MGARGTASGLGDRACGPTLALRSLRPAVVGARTARASLTAGSQRPRAPMRPSR